MSNCRVCFGRGTVFGKVVCGWCNTGEDPEAGPVLRENVGGLALGNGEVYDDDDHAAPRLTDHGGEGG